MTTAQPGTIAPFAEPIRRVPARWITLFATAWFGIWMAQLTPIQLLLPNQIAGAFGLPLDTVAQLKSSNWLDPVMAFGVISAIAGVCALIAYPLTGALSDRTTSKYGRRRPWILAGVVIFAVSLFLLGLQSSLVGIGIFWSLALVGFCVLTAAITATISDQVPVNQRGFVSGWVSAPQAVGTVLGLVLVSALALGSVAGYSLMAVLLLILVVPFLIFVPDAVLPAGSRPYFSARTLLSGFWISPRKFPNFGWTLLSRILVNLGNALGTTQLLYFLAFGLNRGPGVVNDLLLLTIIYMVFFIAAALGMGKLSDRIGQRKIFVYAAAYLQGIAALLLAFVPNFNVAMVAAGLLGLGYGSFMAVDQALATQVLPDVHSRGKDLGIMNIATAVPQAVAPLLGAIIVVTVAGLSTGGGTPADGSFAGSAAGFGGLFVASALAAVLGGLAVVPVKSVK
jgi:MFS family permease